MMHLLFSRGLSTYTVYYFILIFYWRPSQTHTGATPLLPKKDAEVKTKLQYLELLTKDTLKQKGIIHCKIHLVITLIQRSIELF